MSIQAKLISALILLLALIGSHWYAYNAGNRNGTNAEKVKTQAADISRQNTTIQALQDAAKANADKAKADALAAKQEAQNHEKELAAIRARAAADAARRVRIDPDKFCPGRAAATIKAATAGGDGQADTGAAFLPEPFAGDLRQLAARADEVTADLRTLKARVEQAGCFSGN